MTAFVNNVKTLMLMGGLIALLGLVGSMWGTNGMIIALAFGAITNVGAWFFSDKLAIASMRGQRVDEKSGGELFAMVKRLSERANLPMPRVYVCPHAAPNAFATGRSPRHAAVAVTQGALRILSREELEGVMAHELAHVKNRDTLTSCVAATVSGVLATLAYWSMWLGGGSRNENSNPFVVLATVLLASLGAALIRAMISRSREFVADADGAKIAGSPRGLVSALQKLEASSRRIPLQQPNPAMNNMFIVEPFTGETLTRLFASHPPTEARVRALLGSAN